MGVVMIDGQAKKSFGTAPVGSNYFIKYLKIKNLGTSPLTGISVTKDGQNPGDFILPNLPKTIAPGSSITIKVTFTPTAAGQRNARIHINSNDTNENPFDIQSAGMGMIL